MWVVQWCPALCDPMDCSLPGSSVREIFQARILEWVAISFSEGCSQPRDWTRVSCTEGRFLPTELQGKPFCCWVVFYSTNRPPSGLLVVIYLFEIYFVLGYSLFDHLLFFKRLLWTLSCIVCVCGGGSVFLLCSSEHIETEFPSHTIRTYLTV